MTAVNVRRARNQLEFDEAVKLSVQVPVTMTISDSQKLAMNGNLTLDFHRNSYKYQDEAVLTVWHYSYPVVRSRPVNDGYGRNEIVLPISSEVRDFFLAAAFQIDARLILRPQSWHTLGLKMPGSTVTLEVMEYPHVFYINLFSFI